MEDISKSLRIGIDARLWNETGVGRYIRNLIKELQRIDIVNEYVLFVLSRDCENVKSQISNHKFQVKTADVHWHTIKEQLEFPKILKKGNLDLMHFPYFSVPVFYNGKFVVTIHDLILHHFPTGKASTLPSFIYWLKHVGYKFVISQAAKKAKMIITVSDATKEMIIKDLNVPKEKIVITYEGIDSRIKIQDSRIKNLYGKYFLYVGNAYPHKNLERLIKAFSNIKNPLRLRSGRAISNIKLILVGKEDYFYKRLEEKVKKMDLESKIEFKHNVSDEELSVLYKNALALVLPSFMEGFGLPVLEAMNNGCLIVASDIPVFREIANDIPLYFNPTDTHELSNMLESIAYGRQKDLRERKEKGKIQAKKFSWEKTAKETLKIYQSCLGL